MNSQQVSYSVLHSEFSTGSSLLFPSQNTVNVHFGNSLLFSPVKLNIYSCVSYLPSIEECSTGKLLFFILHWMLTHFCSFLTMPWVTICVSRSTILNLAMSNSCFTRQRCVSHMGSPQRPELNVSCASFTISCILMDLPIL